MKLPLNDDSAAMLINEALFNRFDPGRSEREVVARLVDEAFAPELRQSLSGGTREKLVKAVRAINGAPSFGINGFKELKYFTVGLGPVGNYNEAKLSASQRASTVINNVILTQLREFVPLLSSIQTDGVQFSMRVHHQNFVTDNAISSDEWQVYLPYTAIRRFLAADITSQQMIDESIVLIDQNRTKIVLTDG